MSRLKAWLSFPNAVALLALFVALGGSAYAAGVLPVNSVGTAQLKGGSVTSGKVKDGTLKAADIAKAQLDEGPRGSRGPAGPAGGVDTSQFSTTAVSDLRYLRGGLVTVVGSSTISPNNFGSATATCPAGHQAIAGGVLTSGAGFTFITSSHPVIEDQNVSTLSDGLHSAPTAWRAWASTGPGVNNQILKVAVICAPTG
jgi:hypothetical protein